MKKALTTTLLGMATVLASANILITEILYNPEGSDTVGTPVTFAQEWVEIYNSGVNPVDLSGWKLRDEDSNSANWGTLTGVLQPGQAGIITMASEADFKAAWPSASSALILTVTGWGSIANTVTAPGNEVMTILDAADNTIDIADYLTVAPWPLSASGNSIYLLPGFIDTTANDDGANWAAAINGVDGAIESPGYDVLFTLGSVASPGVVVVVPEPSTTALLLGLGALGFLAWRRRR